MLLAMATTHVRNGESMAKSLRFSASEVSSFARLVGDENPIHHDEAAARQARFDGVVVSGPQLSSLLMGMTATHFSRPGPEQGARSMLGLDFRFRFRRAVLAGEAVRLSWEVVAVRPKPSLGGELVFLAGRVRNAGGEDAVKAVGKVLVRANS